MKTYNCGWGYTNACNLKCKHCYNNSGKSNIVELPLETGKKIVRHLKENGVESINYGTGECGLAKNFWELVQYVHEQGILQGLTTNGWSVNEKTIEIIKKCMNDVDVSVDFPDEALHCSFRGDPNAWKCAMKALDLLKENDISRSIVTCIHAKNCNTETVDGFIELSKKYGCSWRINLFRPTGRGTQNTDLKLVPEDVYSFFRYVFKKMKVLALPDPYFAAMLGVKNFDCPCGTRSFRITPDSTVVPCVYFTGKNQGMSIIENSLNDIMNSECFDTFRQRKPDFCMDCEFEATCGGGCTSRAYLEHGKLNAPDSMCHKACGIDENPFEELVGKILFADKSTKVHENYLCTAIFECNTI